LLWSFWLGLAVYLLLTILVATHVLDGLDRAVFHAGERHRHRSLYDAAKHFTDVLSPVADTACLAVGGAVLAWRRHRPAVFIAAATTAWVMAAIVLLTKVSLGRPLPASRPGHAADAFPSGHTATFLVCFGTLALLATTRQRRWRIPLIAAVVAGTLLVAASLVYDGFHWLTDTVGSISLGVSLLSALALAAGAGRRSRPPDHLSPAAEPAAAPQAG
jgi:membrane-associated phospholipid phosphatase